MASTTIHSAGGAFVLMCSLRLTFKTFFFLIEAQINYNSICRSNSNGKKKKHSKQTEYLSQIVKIKQILNSFALLLAQNEFQTLKLWIFGRQHEN